MRQGLQGADEVSRQSTMQAQMHRNDRTMHYNLLPANSQGLKIARSHLIHHREEPDFTEVRNREGIAANETRLPQVCRAK